MEVERKVERTGRRMTAENEVKEYIMERRGKK